MQNKQAMIGVQASSDKVENLQALRGIAALLVLWSHLKFAFRPGSHLPEVLQTASGAVGVDMFFVISGFVICLAATKRHHHPLEFLLARVARVSPLYFVLTAFFLAKELFHLRIPTYSCCWNSFLYLPLLDFSNYTEPVLGPGWTLSFEMWFYAIFALLLISLKPEKIAVVLPLVFAAGTCFMTFYHGSWYFPHFAFHPLTLEFGLGCLAFYTRPWISSMLSWVCLMLGILGIVMLVPPTQSLAFFCQILSADHPELGWFRFFLWGVPCALIVIGLIGVERNSRVILPRFMVGLGEISYSLYLTHLISIQAMVDVAPRVGLHAPFIISFVAIAFGILIGWLCWRFVEKPLTIRAQQWARRVSVRHASLPS